MGCAICSSDLYVLVSARASLSLPLSSIDIVTVFAGVPSHGLGAERREGG